MKNQVWLVTGASRGIGLEMVKQLLAKGHQVIAACRNPDGARDLWEIKADYKTRLRYIQLDVTDPKSVEALGESMQNETVDVLINNAGLLKGANEGLTSLNLDDVVKSFEVNTMGALRVSKALIPSLSLSSLPKVINVSSMMGSIGDNTSGKYYGYRMSKAALNMFNKCFAIEYPKIISIVIHPGWVKTEMGGAKAPLEVRDSVSSMLEVASKVTFKETGRFLNYKGEGVEW